MGLRIWSEVLTNPRLTTHIGLTHPNEPRGTQNPQPEPLGVGSTPQSAPPLEAVLGCRCAACAAVPGG